MANKETATEKQLKYLKTIESHLVCALEENRKAQRELEGVSTSSARNGNHLSIEKIIAKRNSKIKILST